MIHRSIYIALTSVTLLFGVIACFIFLDESPHVWKTVNEEIIYNGQPSPQCELYISSDELVLIDLRSQGDGLYLVYLKTQEIGIPTESNFITAFGYAFIKEISPPLASMANAENPGSIIHPYEVEFTSVKKARVRATWYLNS